MVGGEEVEVRFFQSDYIAPDIVITPFWELIEATRKDEIEEKTQNVTFVTFKKLNGSGEHIPIVNFTGDPIRGIMDESIKWFSVCVLVEVVLILGCSVDFQALKNHIKRPVGVAIAITSQFVLMPLLVFGAVKLLGIPHIPAVVVLLTASVPGGTLSNILAYLVRGDITLSMLMTTCSSILAFAFIPFNLFVYGSQWLPQDMDYKQLIPYHTIVLSLMMMFVPLGGGIIISWLTPKAARKIVKVCKVLLLPTILSLGILSAIVYEDMLLRHMPKQLWIMCTVMPMLGFSFGYLFSTLAQVSDQTRRTVAVETMCQNGQLACAILKVAFPSNLIGSFFIFPLLYSAFQLAEGLLFVAFVRHRTKAKEEKESVPLFTSLGEAPMRRISRVSLYVIERMCRRFSMSDRHDQNPQPPNTSDASEEKKRRRRKASYMNNIIKMAIEEEDEPSGVIVSKISDDDNKEVFMTNDVTNMTIFEENEDDLTNDDMSQISDIESMVEKEQTFGLPHIIKTADSEELTDDDDVMSPVSDVVSPREMSLLDVEGRYGDLLIYATGSSFEEIDFSHDGSDDS